MNKEEIFSDMDELWKYFMNVRGAFPYARPEHIGKSQLRSALYYDKHSLISSTILKVPMTEEDRLFLNNSSYWLNQSFIIRLYCLLEYHEIIKKGKLINTALAGHEELDILRRLRNQFAHTGRYNSKDPNQKKLYDRINNHFSLVDFEPSNFNIPVDKVCGKIYEAIKKYVEEF